jgi:IS30 family transposase
LKLSDQQQSEIRNMISKGDKVAADTARLLKVQPATVSRLLARASSRRISRPNSAQSSTPNNSQRKALKGVSQQFLTKMLVCALSDQ